MINEPTAPTASAASSPQRLDPTARVAISLLLVSGFIMILNETIMSLAIDVVSRDLNVEVATAQWMSTAFMLTMAVVIPVTGYLMQRFSTRTLFIAALSSFSTGTLVAALAPVFGVLVTGRVIQAAGTAVIMPLLMTTVMNLVPPSRRGRIMGNISIVISVAPAIGPTVSGLILAVLPWPFLFWVMLPIGLGVLILGTLRVPNVSEVAKTPLDVISVVLSALAFSGLIFGLAAIGESAHAPPPAPPAAPLSIGAVMLVLFVLRQIQLQRRGAKPLLDLRTFTYGRFATSLSLLASMFITLFGVVILLPIYLQRVLLLEPASAGILLLPGGLVMGLLGPVAGRIFDRFGPRVLVVPGAVAICGAMWALSTLDQDSSRVAVLAFHMLLSIGLGLIFTPLFTTALSALPRPLYSHGSATIGTLQQLGAACGTALFVVIYTLRSTTQSAEGASDVVAEAAGTQAAFLFGGVLSLGLIVLALFVRPTPPEHDAVAHVSRSAPAPPGSPPPPVAGRSAGTTAEAGHSGPAGDR